MKILHLIYTGSIAGAEKYLKHLLPALKNNNIEPYLFIACPQSSYNNIIDYEATMKDLGIPVQVQFCNTAGLLKTAWLLNKYLKKNEIKVLHCHLIYADLIASLLKIFFNKEVTVISTKHGYQENILRQVPYLSKNKLKEKASTTVYYRLSKFIASQTDHAYGVSKAVAELYQHLGLTKTEMPFIHHGVTIPAPDAHNKNLFKKGSPQLAIIGRLETFKGHAFLFAAMQEIIKIFPTIKLVIVGTGSEMNNLKALGTKLGIDNNLCFTGFHPDPYSYVFYSDLIIVPSLFEPFGLVYIEAFAAGKTVIAFDTAAGNEIIENEITGILVPKLDVQKLAENIIDLLRNKDKNLKIGATAYQAYLNKFTTEKMAINTAAYYRNILPEH